MISVFFFIDYLVIPAHFRRLVLSDIYTSRNIKARAQGGLCLTVSLYAPLVIPGMYVHLGSALNKA